MEDKKRHFNPIYSQDQSEVGNHDALLDSSQQKNADSAEKNNVIPDEETARVPEAEEAPGSGLMPAHMTFLTLESNWTQDSASALDNEEQQNTPKSIADLNEFLRTLASAESQLNSSTEKSGGTNTRAGKGRKPHSRHAGEGILIIDPGGKILYANDLAGSILGAPANGLIDRILVKTDFTTTSENQGIEKESDGVTGILPTDGIVGIIRPDGSVSWTRTQSHPLLERGQATGSPIAVLLKKIELNTNAATLEKSMDETITKQLHHLEKVNQELEDFNYSISHDLKSHIFIIEGYCSFIEEEYSEELNDDIVKCLHKIRTRAMTMKNLLDSLLRLSKINAGSLKRHEVNLSDIARNILNDFTALESWRNTSIYVQPDLHELCDPNLVNTAIYNLLDNAWKYTANNPLTAIEFGAENDGRETVFYVRDNGIGFDMKDAENIFKPFKRLRSESEYQGTGIGLVTVRKIVQRHEGRIWVESELGKGATFYFTLSDPDH